LGEDAGLLFLGRLLALFGDLGLHDLGLARLVGYVGGRLLGREQCARLLHALLRVLALTVQAPRALLHLVVEVDLAAEPERDGILRRQVGRVPMAAVADLRNRRFGRADEAHELAVFQLRMIAQKPEHGIGPDLAARQRRIAMARLGGRFWYGDLGLGEVQRVRWIALCGLDLLARELGGRYRIEPL